MENQFKEEDKLIELLSDYEHERWSRWQKRLHNSCILNEDGSLTIPKDKVDRWTRQINTEYKDLSESDKEKDRKEARRIITILKAKN